jgi:hypothetical protein
MLVLEDPIFDLFARFLPVPLFPRPHAEKHGDAEGNEEERIGEKDAGPSVIVHNNSPFTTEAQSHREKSKSNPEITEETEITEGSWCEPPIKVVAFSGFDLSLFTLCLCASVVSSRAANSRGPKTPLSVASVSSVISGFDFD